MAMMQHNMASQAADAAKMYDDRSSTYDDSWHPRFARHLVELASIHDGEHVLDLACGTGLVSVLASKAVGPSGAVTGIDISTGMLAQARLKQQQQDIQNLEFYTHSITDLRSLEPLQSRTFDVITCASALVLLQHPLQAITEWMGYLRPGGRLVVDVTHPESQILGITMERVGLDLGVPVPHYRLAFQHVDDLSTLLRKAGLQQIVIHSISQTDIKDSDQLADYMTDASSPRVERYHTLHDVDSMFERTISHPLYSAFAEPFRRTHAKESFRQNVKRLEDSSGRIREVDCVFVGVATKSSL